MEVTKPGEYIYMLRVREVSKNPAYVLFVTFNHNDVESFKLYTRDQFEHKVKTTLKGPAAFEKEVKAKFGYDAKVIVPSDMVGNVPFNDNNSNTFSYYDFFNGEPIQVTIQQPQNSEAGYYMLTPSWNGELYDFTFKQVK